MVAKKKKQQGHYCRICSEYKANEQFSGKGHSRHICKECRSLPDDVKADMVRCNEVERAVFKCPMSRQDWELLEKYAKKYKDKESGQFAQDMLDMKRGNQKLCRLIADAFIGGAAQLHVFVNLVNIT